VKRKPHLRWKPKKHHCRKVTVSQKFADAFRARGKKSETSLVFPNEAGKPNQHLLRNLQALTPNDKPFHTELHKLRKTWATRLAHAGMSLDVLQKRLGHKNLSTTQKYLADVDLSSKEHTDVVEKATYTPIPKVVKKTGTNLD
jgi:site-specific recombinase XerD